MDSCNSYLIVNLTLLKKRGFGLTSAMMFRWTSLITGQGFLLWLHSWLSERLRSLVESFPIWLLLACFLERFDILLWLRKLLRCLVLENGPNQIRSPPFDRRSLSEPEGWLRSVLFIWEGNWSRILRFLCKDHVPKISNNTTLSVYSWRIKWPQR